MEGCPVEVIKIETKDVEGPAPWANQPAPAAGAVAGGEVSARAPAAKAPAPLGPPDPKFQALLTTSKISPSLSAGLASTIRRSPEVNQADEILRAVHLPKDAPPDQRLAMLAVGGAYQPAIPMGDRLRLAASKTSKVTRRNFNLALVVGWGMIAALTVAHARGTLTEKDTNRVTNLILRYGPLPTFKATAQKLVALTSRDKKNRSGIRSFVLPTAIGTTSIVRDVTEPELLAATNAMLNLMRHHTAPIAKKHKP